MAQIRLSYLTVLLLLTACSLKVNVKDMATPQDLSLTTLSVTSPGVADGLTPVIVTIFVRNHGAPLANFIPTFSVTGSNNTIGICSATNALGISTCQLRSSTAETKTVSLTNPLLPSVTAVVIFDPYYPSPNVLAITSGGDITTGGTIMSHSSIGLPTAPVVLESVSTPGITRARTGLHGATYE